MFYVLSIKEGSILFRRKLYRRPKVLHRRVQGGLPFCVIETSCYRKKINWGEIERICAGFKNRLILPKNIERPKSFPIADCDRFLKKIFANTVCEVIKKAQLGDRRLSMCIIDKNADAADKLSFFVPLISDIFIKTQRQDIYGEYIEKVMDEYGAKIRFVNRAKADIILNLDRDEYILDAAFDYSKNITDNNIKLAYCYSSICPSDIDKTLFAAFLYNFSKVSSLDCLRFSEVNIAGRKETIEAAGKTLKRLCY